MALITQMKHFLDEQGAVPIEIPGPARNLALFLGAIVTWVTNHNEGRYEMTNVICRQNQGRRRCVGTIHARAERDGATITWECPVCGDDGTINGWEGTLWDRRKG